MGLVLREAFLFFCFLFAAFAWLASDAQVTLISQATTMATPGAPLPTTAPIAANSTSAAVTAAAPTTGNVTVAPQTTPSAQATTGNPNMTAGATASIAATTVGNATSSSTSAPAAPPTVTAATSTPGNATVASNATTSAQTTSGTTFATPALDLDAGCDDDVCRLPHCACASELPPAGMSISQVPQFVMLTFDDAVNVVNMKFYRELLEGARRKNRANGCGIAATFFVSHEYLDYAAVNELHSWGNEIALHSISHRTDSQYWQTINSTQWERELLDQKVMLETFANISASDVTGVRGPFLYSGGDQGFRMLQQHFRYDSTLVHQRVWGTYEQPIFPYTMDFGFRRACNVYPCPQDSYPGFWLLPMNVLFRERSGEMIPCAMADACLPLPVSANDTFEYLRSNFREFYMTNRAPFPVFLHEAYLRHPGRKQGYLQFVDWLLQKDDVFLVTASEVLRFMQDPKPLGVYSQHVCPGRLPVVNTCPRPNNCAYKRTPLGGDRYMMTCSRCPRNYPWVGNPLGN